MPFNQGAHDLLAVLAPSHRVGIVANRIPAARARQGDRRLSALATR